jgi:hypothetical protein
MYPTSIANDFQANPLQRKRQLVNDSTLSGDDDSYLALTSVIYDDVYDVVAVRLFGF